MKFSISILLLFIISQIKALNILGIFPYQGRSHFTQFSIYLRELANRGHNVTVISYFPTQNPPPNYTDIYIGEFPAVEDDVVLHKSYLTILGAGVFLTQYGIENCKSLVESPKVRDLVKQKPKFDVVVIEQFNSDCALGIAYVLGAPVVGITSHVLMPYHYKRLGIPSNPSFVPCHFLEGGLKPSLYQRVERTVFNFIFNTLYTYEQWRDHQILAKYYDNIPPLEQLAREIKILLLYQNHILTGSRLLPPNVIEVAGYHVSKAKPLTGDLMKFMEDAEFGVVYISFGSMMKSSNLCDFKKNAIIEAMNEFPQKFVMKWENKNLDLDKNKVYISSWLPQVDILGHPKTLAFVTHGGMGSTVEAVHYGVPLVTIPVFGDQPSNAAAIEERGFGAMLDYNDLTKENLVTALKKVLNPKFRKNAIKLSKAWHDRPMSPMDTAVFWTEYAARHSNFTFRTPAADTPFYQLWNIDVAAVLILFVLISFYTFKMLKFIVRSKKPTANKKRQ